MRKVTTYTIGGRSFLICKDNRGFWGIEDKYVSPDGKILVALNGLRGHLGKTLSETIASIDIQVKIDRLTAEGMPLELAAELIFNA